MIETKLREDGRSNYNDERNIRCLFLHICLFRDFIDKNINSLDSFTVIDEINFIEKMSRKIASSNGILIPINSDFGIADVTGKIYMNCSCIKPLVVRYKELCPDGSSWGFRSFIIDRCKSEIGFSLIENNGLLEFIETFDKFYHTQYHSENHYLDRQMDQENKEIFQQAKRDFYFDMGDYFHEDML